MDQDERSFNQTSGPRTTRTPRLEQFNAADEARQMLDEIAGLDHQRRARASRTPRRATGATIRTVLLWPVLALAAILRLLFRPASRADLRLLVEMRKFLRHPGHFFWFNRVAPEAAAAHFGTASTDAMTHHARRYGAHGAMLLLALVIVLFGGFSGLASRIKSVYAEIPDMARDQANLIITSDGREVYASAVAADSAAFTRRIETITVKEGDTLRNIAAARNLSLETLLYANNLVDPEAEVKPGQKLVVPPVTGMLHITNPGDTIGRIADIYGVDPRVILSYKFNNLEGLDAGTTLQPLREVMVPGGSLPLRTKLYMYTVRPTDTLQSIADKFGLQEDTLLDNNDLDDGLLPGQQIRILPVDGVIYKVKPDETLDAIAEYLGTSPENIINFKPNNVARGVPLQTGASLIVPGGSWPPPPPPEPEPEPEPAPPVRQIIPALPPIVVAPPVRTAPVAPRPAPTIAPKPANNVPAAANAGRPAPAVAPLPKKAAPQPLPAQQPRAAAPAPQPRATAPAPAPQQPARAAAPAPAPQPTKAPAPAPTQKAAPKPAAPGQAVQKPAPAPAPVGPAVQKPAPVAVAPATTTGRATGSMMWPERGVITTYFGQAIWYGIHMGLDISAGCGTPIVAADGGTVVHSGWDGGYGISALVDHGNGLKTRYAHFSRVAVGLGQRVAKGQVVGYEGTTGNSSGCHLHFEVLQNGKYTDPLRWLR